MAGQIIGAYRLLSLIGQGGMGSVWLAERCDGRFEGRAAVKLLNIALVGRAGEERFRREGNFLAKAHATRTSPGSIDAGVSSAGQPYLVLEHVDGQPIDRYCDEQALGIEARIASLSRRARSRGPRAREPDRAPGHQAGQRAGQRRRRGQAARLRHRQAARATTAAGAARRSADAGALTREAGAALTPAVRRPGAAGAGAGHHRDRRLRARRAPLRAAHRPASRRPRRPITGHADCARLSTSSRAACPTSSSGGPRRRRRSPQHAARCGTTPAGCTGRFAAISTRSSRRPSRRTQPSAMSRSRRWRTICDAICNTSRSAPGPIRRGIARRDSSSGTPRRRGDGGGRHRHRAA